MFDYEPAHEEKMRADPSGTIIGLSLLPLFFLFVYLGRAELGFTVVIVLAMALIAIRLNWKMRRYVWFWATIGLVLAIQVPLFFAIRWPDTKVPTIAFSMPLGIAEFLVISGAIRLAQKKFLKDLSPGDDQE